MLSRTGIHAVRAAIALASLPPGQYEGAAAIAERVQAPRNYLGKLLQTLARAGILVSQKGVGGGFALARPANRISLYELLDPLEDVERWSACVLGRVECSDKNPCHVHDKWARVRDAYFAFLRGTTLDELQREGGVERLERFLHAG